MWNGIQKVFLIIQFGIEMEQVKQSVNICVLFFFVAMGTVITLDFFAKCCKRQQ